MIELVDAGATQQLGQRLALALETFERGLVIALVGELGAGKTALARAAITALGHEGIVVSPTYTLLESYPVAGRQLHHLDLYRLADAEELEYIGVRELDATRDWFMIEWPQQGAGYLPAIDLTVALEYAGSARVAQLQAQTATGDAFLRLLEL